MSGAHFTPRIYTFADVVRISGATKSNVTHWAREAVIRPIGPQVGGTGHHRRFGFRSLLEARHAHHFNVAGIDVAVIRTAMESLRLRDDVSLAVAAGNEATVRTLLKKAAKLLPEKPASFLDLWREGRRWQLIKTPEIRPLYMDYFGLAYSLTEQSLTTVLIRTDDCLDANQLDQGVVLVNTGQMLTELEAATGDRWPGCYPPDDVRVMLGSDASARTALIRKLLKKQPAESDTLI